ncbi:MAG TPA: O-antigen ligase family protein [Candidatus Bathyarchaeia archaeon]|nr:O-antigen ligase family protein [Candidatus Bathyarchaeia archaeon]
MSIAGEGASLGSGRPTLVEYGLLALLLWSPLPAASVEEWAVFVIELAAAVMAAAYVVAEPKPALNPGLSPVLKRLRPWTIALSVFLALQVTPLPAGIVRVIAPGSYGFRRLYAPEFERMKFMTLSVAPSETIGAILFFAALFILGFLVLRTVSRGRQIMTILAVLVAAGAFQALYGLFELTRGSPRLLFYPKVIALDSVTGTFVNRNHFCGYVEMIIPLALGLAFGRLRAQTHGAKGFREKLLLWTTRDVLANALILGAVAAMALAIFLSHSRSGLGVLAVTAFLFLEMWLSSFSRTGIRNPWVGKLVRLALVGATVGVLSITVGSTLSRFAREDLLRENRPAYWSATVAMIRDFPLFGTGLGTFAAAYGAYEVPTATELRLVHAHNDYLEYAAELGLLGFVLLLGIILYLALSAYFAWRERRDPRARSLALGGLVSMAGMGLHTVTDFNLHIPANMVLFAVVLGLTLAMAYYRKT